MQIDYIGEELFWGALGRFLIALSFSSALLAAGAYYQSHRTGDSAWKSIGRKSFWVHALSVVGIILLLISLILRHRFEYYYVWEHSNTVMPLRYVLSCLWEGQEGSFLLWSFWHCVLGVLLIRFAGEWENTVLSVFSIVQVFLASMLLGSYIFDYKLGSNPFTLLREHPDFANLPFITMPDYLQKIQDGRGLNPLLQNYWMTIHPPTLFLGFASTLVPFAFAMGGLMRKKYDQWVKPALPWTFFSIMILGTGILMGAAWAYESLSFGGFWAWDPVENASLVPWMLIAALGHVLLIQRHRNRSLWSAYILASLGFLLILYSTFLTRSGILGNSSVHAFTDLGMSGQLIVYMAFFIVMAGWLLIVNRKSIPTTPEEEHLTSREFWMFIGVLVLVLGSIQITFTTSLPVINKIFGTKLAPPADVIDHYNRWQVPVGILVSLLIGGAQFLRYRNTPGKDIIRALARPFLISCILTAAAIFILGSMRVHYLILLFASLFAVTANTDYLFSRLKGRFAHAGSTIAHIGIGLILLGALVSNAKQEVISKNVKLIDLGKDFPNNENIMIEEKTDTLPMGPYQVTYSGKDKEGYHIYYNIDYFTTEPSTGTKKLAFRLRPMVQLNERMGNVAEPATRHFIDKDIYTHVTYAEIEKKDDSSGDFLPAKEHELTPGDTFFTSNSYVILRSIEKEVDRQKYHLEASDVAVIARLDVEDLNRKHYSVEPVFLIRESSIYTLPVEVPELGLSLEFSKIDPQKGSFIISAAERKSNKKDFIIMKAIIFPWINILWIGCLMMIIGSVMAIRKRIFTNSPSPAS
ncbi:MAG: cytochrome c biogenesis protein CcsA [Bacteroidota bacterium]